MANGKQAREWTKAVEEAGGRAEMTRRGHIRVFGPDGIAHISACCTGPRARANNLAAIARVGLGRAAP